MIIDGKPFVPRCVVCKAFACIGIGVDLKPKKPKLGTWYCDRHQPRSAEPAAAPPVPNTDQGPGRLL